MMNLNNLEVLREIVNESNVNLFINILTRFLQLFFSELNNESAEKFYSSYYKDKPKEYKDAYIQILKEFKKYNC